MIEIIGIVGSLLCCLIVALVFVGIAVFLMRRGGGADSEAVTNEPGAESAPATDNGGEDEGGGAGADEAGADEVVDDEAEPATDAAQSSVPRSDEPEEALTEKARTDGSGAKPKPPGPPQGRLSGATIIAFDDEDDDDE